MRKKGFGKTAVDIIYDEFSTEEAVMWTEVKEILGEFAERDWTMAEKLLFGLVCLFGGLIVGFVFSPVKKGIALGSHNGCNNGNGNEECLCEEEEE